ncbi:DUF3331 domain-containing protein [Paraburkholderia unamae]|uniref:Uncharacterized protein DUF3331 n=1 Tax=Paraburkholderia unamae TaxID=219649 RepID=A0ABX5KT04_9BURK|nr:DUF3331 domain-containing protein [Paraburkholderia unamae]PVX85914.1 uncharacterized protein DUF3331 [Paraburkholderia unamae]
MDVIGQRSSPWLHILAMLERFESTHQALDSTPRHRLSCQPRTGRSEGVAIRIIERPTPYVASVTWTDSTSCHYGEQLWTCAKARRSGVCVLSGESIQRGDEVFRPLRRRRQMPANAGFMMLAASVRGAPVAR